MPFCSWKEQGKREFYNSPSPYGLSAYMLQVSYSPSARKMRVSMPFWYLHFGLLICGEAVGRWLHPFIIPSEYRMMVNGSKTAF